MQAPTPQALELLLEYFSIKSSICFIKDCCHEMVQLNCKDEKGAKIQEQLSEEGS